MDLKMPEKPNWTVLTNIVSPEQDLWIGTCWEFFHDPISAKACYERHVAAGNCPCMRPYHEGCDRQHLGAAHRMQNAGAS